jgi:polyphosphate kinase 2 (PPK2 family)
VRVHPELLRSSGIHIRPTDRVWNERFDDINAFEHHLARNNTLILKFFLHISREEQKQRFIDRLKNPKKRWKFSLNDLAEREHWDAYQQAYQSALRGTSTPAAPWYIIPADEKWAARAIIAEIIASQIERLDLRYPIITPEQERALAAARRKLLRER